MSNSGLTNLFNHLVGQEVPLNDITTPFEIDGKTFDIHELHLQDENHPVIVEAQEIAKANGLILRIMWPGMVGTCDHQISRVNMTINQTDKDKTWRVQNFSIG